MTEKSPFTHGAYAKKREGRIAFRWLEIGMARVESDGNGVHHLYIDRLPVGGFDGHIYLSPIGVRPADQSSQPQRPNLSDEDDEV